MAEHAQPHHPAPAPESLMTEFLSAEELHGLVMRHEAEAVQARASERSRQEEDRRRRMDMFRQRRELTPEIVQRAITRWQNAARQGDQEVEVIRFPSQLCTDDGRAINNGEPDWSRTLVGVPAQIYEIWERHLRPRGFGLKAYIVDFPDGKPGDVGMYIHWG